ncbi:flagellar hook-length control protein FliK [Arcobacter sp.]|uniref:flagellar hook-length control protein FliK n=1 Tax=Arcobacter sp. TaxID=1872629 RepID=UPI003C71DC19
MLVSTNTQLNILVANSTNKVLKEVLKEADVKTLITSQNKDLNVSTLLKSLFSNIQNNSKSNETILNLLKNSNLNKDLGSFTSNLQSLVKALPDDKSTEQLKTFLQKFSITPEQTTSKEVKEQIQKSGIFLESKLLNQATNPNSKNENSLLNDMKAVLLKTKAQLEAQISTQSKTQVSNQKVETTPQNSNQAITQSVSKENINIPETLKQIDKLLIQIKNLETPNIPNESKPTQQVSQQTTTTSAQSIKSDSILLNDIKNILTKVQAQLQGQVSNQKVETTPQNSNQAITQSISKENINIPQTLKQIDKLLVQIKNLETPNIKEQVVKPNIPNESKPTQQVSQQTTTTSAQSIKSDSVLLNDIKNILTKVQAQLQGQVSNEKIQSTVDNPSKQVETTPQGKEQQIKSTVQSTSQLLQMKVQLKEEAKPQAQNLNKENINVKDTLKQIDKILTDIKKIDLQNPKDAAVKIATNLDAKTALQSNTFSIKTDSPMFNDIKTVLSKVQAQLQNQIQNQTKDIDDIKPHISKDADPKDILKHVDKLLTQIDYHQLYSIANSSNNVYVPFLWDLLEDGSIDIKKADDEKFYCLIDLTLKDLGKINLHLYLYEDDKLDISVFVEKDDTKQLIRQKATSLRRELNGTGISVIGLNIHTLKEDTKQNFYKQDDDFDFGVNIKV